MKPPKPVYLYAPSELELSLWAFRISIQEHFYCIKCGTIADLKEKTHKTDAGCIVWIRSISPQNPFLGSLLPLVEVCKPHQEPVMAGKPCSDDPAAVFEAIKRACWRKPGPKKLTRTALAAVAAAKK